jgi:uncharacterized protein (TIGR00369 family)
MTKLTVEAANAFLQAAFAGDRPRQDVIIMETGRAVVRLEAGPQHLRPGGYISGPTQMSLVDTAAYMAVMTETGLLPMAVTSHLSIHFLRPCIGPVVIVTARMVKHGRALAVLDCDVRIEGAEKAASQATVTYALPNRN